jgi:hypothetical protein
MTIPLIHRFPGDLNGPGESPTGQSQLECVTYCISSSAMLHHIVAVVLVAISSSDAFQALGKYSHWGRCSPLRMSHGSNAVKTSLRIATGLCAVIRSD